MAKSKKKRSGRAMVAAKRQKKSGVDYKCTKCGYEEKIPASALEIVEVLDDDSLDSPTFKCIKCGGTMESTEDESMPTSGILIEKEFNEKELEGDWLF
jgi:predicted RNA-binding Zn-ribbon protein involved in translation (DUF1610 family)